MTAAPPGRAPQRRATGERNIAGIEARDKAAVVMLTRDTRRRALRLAVNLTRCVLDGIADDVVPALVGELNVVGRLIAGRERDGVPTA